MDGRLQQILCLRRALIVKLVHILGTQLILILRLILIVEFILIPRTILIRCSVTGTILIARTSPILVAILRVSRLDCSDHVK